MKWNQFAWIWIGMHFLALSSFAEGPAIDVHAKLGLNPNDIKEYVFGPEVSRLIVRACSYRKDTDECRAKGFKYVKERMPYGIRHSNAVFAGTIAELCTSDLSKKDFHGCLNTTRFSTISMTPIKAKCTQNSDSLRIWNKVKNIFSDSDLDLNCWRKELFAMSERVNLMEEVENWNPAATNQVVKSISDPQATDSDDEKRAPEQAGM